MNILDKDFLLNALYEQGREDALELRAEAFSLTGTEIIDRETAVPSFDGTKDYSTWAIGSPVADEGQVWTLLQPYNAAHYEGRPSTLRALWGLCHTTNPDKAKPWVEPYGTSGMYMKDECYRDEEGNVWRALKDNLVYTAQELPSAWEKV
jgi:hypothetical protein